MSFTRRRFVATTSLGVAGSVVGAENAPVAENLSIWLNTILPGDESSPSATELRVDIRILDKAERFPNYTTLLSQGFSWANEQATIRKADSFADLDEASRIELLRYSQNAAATSGPRILFDTLYRDAMDFYYGTEGSWESIGFPHAPQPLGFPDYEGPFA